MITKAKQIGIPEKYLNRQLSIGCRRIIQENTGIITPLITEPGNHLYIEHNEISSAELASEFAIAIIMLHLKNEIPIKHKLNYVYTLETFVKDFDYTKYYLSDLLLLDGFKVNEYQVQNILPLINYRLNNRYNTIFVSPLDNKTLPKAIWAIIKPNCKVIKI